MVMTLIDDVSAAGRNVPNDHLVTLAMIR